MANNVPSLQNLARMGVINLIFLDKKKDNCNILKVVWDNIPRKCPITNQGYKSPKLQDLQELQELLQKLLHKPSSVELKQYRHILFYYLAANRVPDFKLLTNVLNCDDRYQLFILVILAQAKPQNFNDWNAIFLRWGEIKKSLHILYGNHLTSNNQQVFNYLEISNQRLLFNGKSVLANPTFTLMLLQAHGPSTFHHPYLDNYLVLLNYIIEIVAKSNHEALDLAEYFSNIEAHETNAPTLNFMQLIVGPNIVGPINRLENLRRFIMESNHRILLPEILHILASHPNPKKLAQAFIYLHENGISNIEIWKKDRVLVVERYLEYLNKNRRINRLFILLEIALGLLSLIFIVAFAACKLPLLIMLIPPSFALTLVTCMLHGFLSETKDLTSYATNTQRYDESTTIQATTITHSV